MGRRMGLVVKKLAAAIALLALTAAMIGGIHNWRKPTLRQQISNYDQVIASIRHGLKNHSRQITVRFRYPGDVMEELSGMVGDWVEEALAETEDPAEGDYIRYQYGGYSITCQGEPEGAETRYTVDIFPDYYMYLVQEEAVTERLELVYQELGLRQMESDYERIQAVYAYVCAHVQYDKVHKKHPNEHMRSTAYGALIRQSATCQGYCVLLYRMLRENGIGCRIVTGTGYGPESEEYHAWNIAELDGKYYALDATWDAGQETWQYFLKGSGDFVDHIPDDAFTTPAFRRAYPMAEASYIASANFFQKTG